MNYVTDHWGNELYIIQNPYIKYFLYDYENPPQGVGLDDFSRGMVASYTDNGFGVNGLGRIFLTHIINRAFNIYRYPGYEEKFYDPHRTLRSNNLRVPFDKMKPSLIDDAVEEVKRIYAHSQKQILQDSRAKLSSDGKCIFLNRGLRGCLADALIHAVRLAQKDADSVTFPANTINSFAYGSAYVADGAYIKQWIPVEDVLLSHRTVHGMKEDELFVLNRDPRGLFCVDLTSSEVKVPNEDMSLQRCIRTRNAPAIMEEIYAVYNYMQFEFKDPSTKRCGWLPFDKNRLLEIHQISFLMWIKAKLGILKPDYTYLTLSEQKNALQKLYLQEKNYEKCVSVDGDVYPQQRNAS